MTLTFESSILLTQYHDYKADSNNGGVENVLAKILGGLRQNERPRQSRSSIWIGLLGICVLSAGAQVAMALTEVGGILPWYCVSAWWFHLWYLLGKSIRRG